MAGSDAKVTFKVELDDSQLRGQLNSVVNQLNQMSNGKKISVSINADATAAKGTIDTLNSDLNNLSGKNVTPTINADDTAAKNTIDDVDDDLDTLGSKTVTATIGADGTSAHATIDEVNGALDGIDGKHVTTYVDTEYTTSGSDSSSSSSSSGTASSVVSSGKDLFTSIFEKGSAYEKSRAKASTLMPTGADLAAWDAVVSGLSTTYGQSGTSYNEAAYNMLSAGQSFADLPTLLDLSSKLAIGGFTDVNTASGMLARVGNAYGTNDYASIANAALIAQNYGITDVGQLATALPMTASTANMAGVSSSNLLSAYAAITKGGVQTNVASTYINGFINELTKSDSKGSASLASAAAGTQYEGMNFSQMMAAGASVGDVARMLYGYSSANGISMADMFGNDMASRAVGTILGSDNGDTFDQALTDMTSGIDAVTPAFETMADTTATQMDIIMAEIENSLVQLFVALAPALNTLLDVMTRPEMQEALDALITAFGELVSSGALQTIVEALTQAGTALAGLVSGNSTPLGTIGNFAGGIVDKIFGRGGSSGTASTATGGSASRGNGAGRGVQEAAQNAERAGLSSTDLANGLENAASGIGDAAGSTSEVASEASAMSDAAGTARNGLGRAGAKAMSAASSASSLASNLSVLAAKVAAAASVRIGGGTTTPEGSKAVGLSYVPRDNYVVALHKGEMVLTAAQASAYRSAVNGGGSVSTGIDYGALSSAMSNVTMTMDGKTVGKLVERGVSQQQAARLARTRSSR